MADIPAERRKLLERAERQVQEAMASRRAVEAQIETSNRLMAESRRILSNTREGRGSLFRVVSRDDGSEDSSPRS